MSARTPRASRTDAHQHFWKLARGDYRWLKPALGPLYRDFGPADLAPHLSASGIEATVLVQAADSAAETEYLLDLADANAFVAGVVGWTDLAARGAPDALARLAERPKLVGVRPMIQDIADERWMLGPALEPALRALPELGLAFDALVLPRHLPHLAALLDRHPDLDVAIDHGSKPRVAEGTRWSGFEAWRRDLAALARNPRVVCKLSGLATEARAGWSADDLRPFAETLLELFGPQRVVWGSDWPVVEGAGGWTRWWDATGALLAQLTEDQRGAVLSRNAWGFYGLARSATGAPRMRSTPQGRT